MTITDSQIVENLRSAIKDLEAEREREIGAIEASYRVKIESIQRALDAFTSNGHLDRATVPDLSIGEDKLEALRQHLREHPLGVRQADIAKAIGLNSGTVSVGLRRLKLEGEIHERPKIEGSTVWAPSRVPAAAVERTKASESEVCNT